MKMENLRPLGRKDAEPRISGFSRKGIEPESTGLIGGSITFTYLDSQKDLETIFEALKVDPGKKNTLSAYGTRRQAAPESSLITVNIEPSNLGMIYQT